MCVPQAASDSVVNKLYQLPVNRSWQNLLYFVSQLYIVVFVTVRPPYQYCLCSFCYLVCLVSFRSSTIVMKFAVTKNYL